MEIRRKNGTIIRNSEAEEEIEYAAAPIIKEVVYNFLQRHADKPVALKDLRNVVYENTGKNFSSGSFSGAMRDLIEEKNGRIINIERGYYIYLKNFKHVQLSMAIDEFMRSLDLIATDNILELTDEDIKTIRKIPEVKNQLERIKRTIN